jgi:Tol biopolymer transport system component
MLAKERPSSLLASRESRQHAAPTHRARGMVLVAILMTVGALPASSSGASGNDAGGLVRNGGLLVFARTGKETPDQVSSHLYVISSRGGSPRLLVPTVDVHDGSPAWSPNGSKLAFDRTRHLVDDKVVVATADGSNVREIADGANPVWSPNGREIAFGSPGSVDSSRVFVIHPDGSGERQVGSAQIEAAFPAWSPNGRQLAFTGGPVDRSRDFIYVVGENGRGEHQLTHVGADAFAWSPDGKLIAFSNGDNRHTKLNLVSSDGGKTRRLLAFSPASVGIINSLAWSPNGKAISFEGFAGAEGDGPESTYIVQSSGRGLKRVRRSEDAASWSPDGHALIFRTFYRKSHAFEIVNARGRLLRWIDISPANDYSPAWQPLP